MSSSGPKKPRLVAEKRYSQSAKPKPKPKAAKRKRKAQPKKRGFLGWIIAPFAFLFRMIWGFSWRIAALGALILVAAIGYQVTQLPEDYRALIDGRARGSVTFLDREGLVFAWRGDQFGAVSANSVAPELKHAVVATEDKRFFRHLGVSPRGIASAIRINMREGRGPLSGNGGSTITQQTAKLLCLGVPYDGAKWSSETSYESDCRRTTIPRKIKEMIYAFAMEVRYSKDEILSIYMNRAYLGGGARGFEAASQRYFGKSAANVALPEAAMMAGLLKAPSSYSPTNNLQRARDRAATVLKLMREQRYISTTDEAAANAAPASLSRAAKERAGGHFVDWVMDSTPAFLTRDTTEDVLIKTTFDNRLQKAAEEALRDVFESKVKAGSKAEAAIVVMSPDGAVRAMVGGRENNIGGGFNRATEAKRQTGSAFKPFVYAAAMDLGFRYDSVVEDAPLTIDIPGSGPWSPKNYTRSYGGPMTLTDALVKSVNTVAVRVSEEVGRDNVRALAEAFGIDNELAEGPALALGVSESTLLEMTGAYAGILNGGLSVTPYGSRELRIKGDQTPLLGQEGGFGDRILSAQSAQQLTYMMHRVISSDAGTGRRARLPDREAAGKTGTTQAAKDAWFIGFTAQYVVGVWMGYDDNTPLTGVTGGGLPADIWRETMQRINADLPAEPLQMIHPANPPRATPARPAPQSTRVGRPRRQQQERSETLEDVILDVLGRIFRN